MSTLDKIKLPPHDATANLGGSPPVRLYSEAKVRVAIEADRKQRHLKERAQLNQEWAALKGMQAQYEADRKRRRSDAEAVCGEAYQVVGSLLSDLGVFETEEAQKVMDNLSEARLVHQDVLPWPSFERGGEPVAWIHEDELPDSYPYDDMHPFSKVDGVRLFPVFWPETVLTPGYIDGHRDGLEWAARLAEANHPLTSDWLYDDPHDLAKAIRKGPEMPPIEPQPANPAIKESLTVAEPVKEASNTQIREVFIANGFAIPHGHDDLKPYVYAAARDLLARYGAPMSDKPACGAQNAECERQRDAYQAGFNEALEQVKARIGAMQNRDKSE